MNVFLLPSIHTDIINVLIGLFATSILISGVVLLFRGYKSITSRFYFLVTVPILAWSYSMIFFRSATSVSDALFWVEWLYFFPPLIPLTALYLVKVFPERTFKIDFSEFLILLIPLFYIGYITFGAGGLIQDVVLMPGSENMIYFSTVPYVIYSALITFYWAAAYYILYKKYQRAKNRAQKRAVELFFTGFFISTTIAVIGNLVLPYYGIFVFNWVGQVGLVVMISCVLYSILTYNLFNVKVVATEIFAYLLVVLMFVRLIYAEGIQDIILNSLFFVGTLGIGQLLINSVAKEIKSREKIEKLAQDLRAANMRLKEMDELKTQFLSIASHQFRSPLTAIKGYTSNMIDGTYGEVSEKLKVPIERVFTSAEHLALIVDDFLNLSRIEQGRMNYEMEIVDLKEFVESAVDEQRAVAEKKGIDLGFTPKGENFNASIDRGKFKQVVTNLIDNALKYTPKGSINVSLGRTGGLLRISVADTGVGVPKDEIDSLFGQFKRATNANNVNVMGTGLGLYIAKEIVQAHKGKIWVESEGEGKGSTFIIEVPAV